VPEPAAPIPAIRLDPLATTCPTGSAEIRPHHRRQLLVALAIALTVVTASLVPDNDSQPRHRPTVVSPDGRAHDSQVPVGGRGLDAASTIVGGLNDDSAALSAQEKRAAAAAHARPGVPR
jgi:hypothetical protein